MIAKEGEKRLVLKSGERMTGTIEICDKEKHWLLDEEGCLVLDRLCRDYAWCPNRDNHGRSET